MADVIPIDRERGQILLLGGLILAATFVLLAVILNGMIYAENVASQGEDARADDALRFRSETEEAIAGTLRQVNGDTSLGPAAFTSSIRDWESVTAELMVERGARVSVRTVTVVGDSTHISSVTIHVEYQTRRTYYAVQFEVKAP